METFCAWMFLLAFIAFIVVANIEYHRELKAMTPEERAAFKQEMRDQGRIW